MKASYGAAYSIEPLIRIGSFQRGAMHVDQWTRAIAVFGLLMVAIIFPVQLIVVLKPEIYWISDFFYKGPLKLEDRGSAWADILLYTPLQIAASVGMLLGHEWGFLLGIACGAVMIYLYILIFVVKSTLYFWVIDWGVWPVFASVESFYAFYRLLTTY